MSEHERGLIKATTINSATERAMVGSATACG